MNTLDRIAYLQRACEYAIEKHKGQLDDCGKDYFSAHVLPVVKLVGLVTDDLNLQCAAALHDVVEDCDVTYEELRDEFNEDIADLVMEVTHAPDVSLGKYFPNLHSERAIVLKFADRLSNLSRMDSWDEGRKQHYLDRSRFWKLYSGERVN